MSQSPYERYSDVLLDDTYSTARLLQSFVLYQYQSGQHPFDIEQHRGGFDSRHIQIYRDLKQWYWENGPSPSFYAIVDVIIAKRNAASLACIGRIAALQSMDPRSYPADGMHTSVECHRADIDHFKMHRARWLEMGFPRD